MTITKLTNNNEINSHEIGSLNICIIGSVDNARYFAAVARDIKAYGKFDSTRITAASPGEARSIIFSERPHILVVQIDVKTTISDLTWLRGFLRQVRDRFKNDIYIIALLTTPEKLTYGGALLFRDNSSLTPSGLLDNIIIAPPAGIPTVSNTESQLVDCLQMAAEEILRRKQGKLPLPHLWDDGWVPTMCDQVSRNVWMRWLPRYASYINENALIVGPTGSGKTRLARAIHKLSGREGPFVSITPRDFSSAELVQAELFGAVSGAYTGAVDKWGLVKRADKGTLFIDELQSIDRDLQGKLITFIENKTYRRVGEAESHEADVRFVFATNRTLHDLVAEEILRDDFAYRLERLQISLAPISGRRLDIAAGACFSLAKVLIERFPAQVHSHQSRTSSEPISIEGMTNNAYRILFSSSWPGNLRQLENTVAKLVELADMREIRLIDTECIGSAVSGLLGKTDPTAADVFKAAAVQTALVATTEGFDSLVDCMLEFAQGARSKALEFTGGDTEQAAKLINDSPKAMSLFSSCL